MTFDVSTLPKVNVNKNTKDVIDKLNELINNDNFMISHHRNASAVNLCIYCHILGLDPVAIMSIVKEEGGADYKEGFNHIIRVEPYVYEWGPEGNERRALDYLFEQI